MLCAIDMGFNANLVWEADPLPKQAEANTPAIPAIYKKKFGEALAKGFPSEFQAALSVFVNDTNTAMWASKALLNDPEVIQAKEEYLKSSDDGPKLLDKEAFATKLLKMADEKTIHAGKEFYVMEAKDRLKALEMYAKTMDFLGPDIDLSQKKFVNNNNFVEIVLVEPEKQQEAKIIEHQAVDVQTLLDDDEIELVETEAA